MTPDPEAWPYVDADRHGWPLGERDNTEFRKQLDLAKLEVRKKRTDQEIARAQADVDADWAIEAKFYEAVFEVAKGSIERARASADFVQKAASAIVGIYTAVLAVAFSVSTKPMPARGIIPAFFLGLAILCATYFIAWLPDPEATSNDEEAPGDSFPAQLANRLILWTKTAALERERWLRASVVALAAGLFLLPAPFVSLGVKAATTNEVNWPDPKSPRAHPDAPIALRKILYQAQVNQTAAAKPPPVSGRRDRLWWLAAGIALLLVFVLPRYPRRAGADAPS